MVESRVPPFTHVKVHVTKGIPPHKVGQRAMLQGLLLFIAQWSAVLASFQEVLQLGCCCDEHIPHQQADGSVHLDRVLICKLEDSNLCGRVHFKFPCLLYTSDAADDA